MTILTADELIEVLAQFGVAFEPLDQAYCLPTKESFLEQTAAQFHNLEKLGVTYQNEAFDCNTYARLARDLMRVSHARTSDHPKAALAVGMFCYQPWGSSDGHAIVCAITKSGDKFELTFAEPQNGKEIHLSENEQHSCYRFEL